MFGTNKIHGAKTFKDLAPNELKVTSMFYTLQGEGPFSGRPAYFVRLSHCNLDCSFCDTLFEQGEVLTFEQIKSKFIEDITKYCIENNTSLNNCFSWLKENKKSNIVLVVTGGEPLLQKNLIDFLDYMKDIFCEIQIETNGTQDFSKLPNYVTVVCSPKCLEKDKIPTRYLIPSNENLNRANCLKFVMSSDSDSPYSKVPNWALDWKFAYEGKTNRNVYVSPMNVYLEASKEMKIFLQQEGGDLEKRSTKDEVVSFWSPGVLNMELNKQNHEYTADYCLKNGLTLSLQTHLLVSLA